MARLFERFLWSSRLIVIVAVLASLVGSLLMFYVTSVDVAAWALHALTYRADEPAADRTRLVAHLVQAVDGYLLAAIMLIFALGLYELFINRIETAEGSEFASRVLLIRSLDDLKDRLGKVIILIVVVKFFEYALAIPVATPLELLYLSLAILLVAAALYLTHSRAPHA